MVEWASRGASARRRTTTIRWTPIVGLLIVSAVVTILDGPLVTAVVTLESNAYKGLVVAIHNDVPDNPEMIDRIKDMMTSASDRLHQVTRRRAYFEDVTVVVPSDWAPRDDYEVVQGGDRFSHAEVRVDEPNPAYGAVPYTLQPGECGEPGEYIHLTPEFLLRPNDTNDNDGYLADEPAGFQAFGDLGRVLVHEWAHLRYGTFDEHGYQNDEQSPPFYMSDQGMIHPTSCTEDLRGWLLNSGGDPCVLNVDGLPDANCLFYPTTELLGNDTDSYVKKKASVMYMPALEIADGFCDDDSEDRRHNAFAPSKHNLMCQGRSTWDVVSKHADFLGDRNPPRDLSSTLPRFRVIQPKKNQRLAFVLVLDISGSMLGRRMELLRAATSRFIKYQLSDFCTVGMVSFSTASKTLANMTAMDEQTRKSLLDRVPFEDDKGFTAIGSGIKEALDLLRRGREPMEGTLLLLVSDGEENVQPYINDVIDDIKAARVIINTIAFGRHASTKLEKLVKMTGGKGFFYDDEKVSHKVLDSAFIESAATQADVELQPVEIASRHVALKSNEQHEGFFLVDKDLGKATEFLVTYDYPTDIAKGAPLEVVLWSPRGKKYSSKSPEYTEDPRTLSISIIVPEAEPGKWKYWIQNKHAEVMDVSFVISSEPTKLSEQPIRVRSWISDVDFTFPSRVKVYAEVKKGYNPIVEASVVATIDRPNGEPWLMVLFDDGAGADTTANDGIYSAYFAHLNGSGRYSVEAVVINNGRARVSIGGLESGASRAPHLPVLSRRKQAELGNPQSSFSPEEMRSANDVNYVTGHPKDGPVVHLKPVDNFERFSSAGSFRLEEWKDDADMVAPSRVIDLRVVEALLTDRTVRIEWTSPGDDLDDGPAALTEVRFHTDPLSLLQKFSYCPSASSWLILEGDILPPAARTLHSVRLRLPAERELQLNASNHRLYFAVRARDEAGNLADVSNLALAHFRDPPEVVHIMDGDRQLLAKILWAALVALVVIAVMLAVSLIALRVRSRRRHQKKYVVALRVANGRQTGPDADGHQVDKLLA